MQVNSRCHNYSGFIYPFENSGKEAEKLQKTEYIKNKKSLLDEMKKNIFHNF